MWDAAYPYLAALLPTIGILVLFYVVMRNLMAADRHERRAAAQWEAGRAAAEERSASRDRSSRRPVNDRQGNGPFGASGATGSANEVDGSPTTAQHWTEGDDQRDKHSG